MTSDLVNANDVTWGRSAERITCRSLTGAVIYDDTLDHWHNAVCRLLGLSDERAQQWVEASAASAPDGRTFDSLETDERLSALAAGARRVFGMDDDATEAWAPELFAGMWALDEPVDCVWGRGIRSDASVAVVGSKHLGHGILVRAPECGGGAVPQTVYEEKYFESGDRGVSYGYGDYPGQIGWRLEKSARQMRQLEGIALWAGTPFSSRTRILDVGSSYGYFRKIASDRGFEHVGVDVSRHAAEAARSRFGFETSVGTLPDFAARGPAPFDVITMFDTLEHLADPVAEVRTAAGLLKPGGLLAVRTPNLLAVEFDVFGRYYHSLKMEHLHYFSGRSLCRCFELAGVPPQFLTTEAHLLTGFLGTAAVHSHARTLRGSDLLAVGQKSD